jgi:hypothetical protein
VVKDGVVKEDKNIPAKSSANVAKTRVNFFISRILVISI